ncbi:MAG: glycosyltransferase family 4 protein, partial [Candidatus Heimdallarchaeota archaeon]|nr:glycosyltransferase family 4 protein [Candidatus Heimdallarchaeota archaeon]
AITLTKEGHKVTVLCWDRTKEHPIRESMDGIDIVRFRNTRFMDLLKYDFFRFRFWCKEGYKMALDLHRKEAFDIIHCHDLDTLPIGIGLKNKTQLPLIYDAHEIWGYMAEKDFPKSIADGYLKKEKKIIKHVDEIITVNDPLKKYFQKMTKKPVTIVMNCKHLIETYYEPTNNKQFTVIYIGSLGNSRFLMELVEVMKELKNVHCIIGGVGKSSFVEIIKAECSKIKNIDFIGRVPFNDVIPMTKKADVVICMFEPNNRNNKVGLPNKIFEAMVCGRPVIATKDIYSGSFVEKNKCGIASVYSKKSLKNSILTLKENPKLCMKYGENALKAGIETYNWEKQAMKLKGVYERLNRDG